MSKKYQPSPRIAKIEKDIIDKYLEIQSLRKTAEFFEINIKTVVKILEANNIERVGNSLRLEGLTFGLLSVVKEDGKDKSHKTCYICECSCGTRKRIRGSDLKSKKIQSCGKCLLQKGVEKRYLKHCQKKTYVGGWAGYEEISGKLYKKIINGAKKRNLEFDISMPYLWNLFLKQNRKCALTGEPLYFNLPGVEAQNVSLDRIDSKQGYIEGNVQWVTKKINLCKQQFSNDGFIKMCESVVEYAKDKKRGNLYKTRVYLAGNLENTENEFEWRYKITQKLTEIGVTCLDPTKKTFINYDCETKEQRFLLKQMRSNEDYDGVAEYIGNVVRKDLRCIDLCDFVIVNLEASKPTFGTVHEMALATQQNKPIIVIVENKKEFFPLWFCSLIEWDYVFESIDEAFSFLKKLDSMKIEKFDKKWKILCEELR